MSNLYFRGDTILLYVKFKDENEKLATRVINPMVNVKHEKDGNLVDDLPPTDLIGLSNSEYFYSLQISHESDYGFREVIYSGEIEGKIAQVTESFHVIPKASPGENAIRIYGITNQLKSGHPLISVSVKVSSMDNFEIYSESFTKDDGSWECYLYPGEYRFLFNKFGFNTQELVVQIGNEHTEMKFANVSLESEKDVNKGKGIYTISDRYLTKNSIPLYGLKVEVFSMFSLKEKAVAVDVTNDDGAWEVFLDPGTYLLKVSGNSMGSDYDYTFRLKVDEDGSNQFENLSTNVAVATDAPVVQNGNGSEIVTDAVLDRMGNPIIDVQVNVFLSHDQNTIIAQDYTDVSGKWEVYLDPGTYLFEYYHPKFNVITETRTIS